MAKNSSQMLLPFSDHETQLHLTLLARQPWLQARARQIEDCFGNTAGHAATFRRVWQCGAILVHECQFRLACLGAPKVQRVSCYTCWKHSSSRSCLQAWWKLAGRCGQECRLTGTGRRGWVAAGLQRRGPLFTLAKDTTLINQKFQDRFGKVGRVKSCMSLYVCSNYCKHCSSNAPAGRQAEKRKPHQFRLRLAVFLPRYTRGPWPSTHWQTRAPATRDGQCGWGLNKAARPEFRAQVGEGQHDAESSRSMTFAGLRLQTSWTE